MSNEEEEEGRIRPEEGIIKVNRNEEVQGEKGLGAKEGVSRVEEGKMLNKKEEEERNRPEEGFIKAGGSGL